MPQPAPSGPDPPGARRTMLTLCVVCGAPEQVSNASLRQAMRAVVAQEGVAGLYRGVTAVAAGESHTLALSCE